jgi:4-amino-4-deoxy-L-arabinose transferase-like glycosyltransferase
MKFDPRRHAAPLVGAFWLALMLAVIAVRPLTPVDETCYAAVAWAMLHSGDASSLRLNGALYGHKPPLMFWLIDAGWLAFGPSVWWPRLLTGLFALSALLLVAKLARRLAPGRDDLAAMTLLVTASSLYWMAFTGAVMFDLMLAFFVLLGVLGIARAADGGGPRDWLLVGIALGLGILTKGPVALLHLLPLALLAPWWRAAGAPADRRWGRWYGGVALAVAVGAAIALAWAVPAGLAGGGKFGREIFWSQSVDGMVNTAHHFRPFWFYIATAPLLLLPWLFFPPVWRGFAALARGDRRRQARFALAWTVPVFVAFSQLDGKQVQYLLPLVPAFALLAAMGLASLAEIRRWETALVAGVFIVASIALAVFAAHPRVRLLVTPGERPWVWLSSAVLLIAAAAAAGAPLKQRVATVATIASASVAMMVGLYAGVGRALLDAYDLAPIGGHLARAQQQQGRPIAHLGKYHGQFQFVGRLRQPLEIAPMPDALLAWGAQPRRRGHRLRPHAAAGDGPRAAGVRAELQGPLRDRLARSRPGGHLRPVESRGCGR